MVVSKPLMTEPSELPQGMEFDGRYRIRSMLGEGGLGCVYLVEDLDRGHDVALKIPILQYRGRLEREQRLLNEATLARQIGAHANLPQLFDSGRLRDLDDCPYVTWEVVQGRDLNTLLMLRYTIVPRIAAQWARQLSDVLCTMHQARIVHRDVTVTNVFIEEPETNPRVKLIDLSHSAQIPRRSEPHHRITREMEVPGAHRFMSPEQARAAPPHPKMDVFSFGVVLHEMLTGRNPFEHVKERETYIELQSAGQLQVARIDRRVYPDIPEALVDLVTACTHNEVDRRIDMTEVRTRLDELPPLTGRLTPMPAAGARSMTPTVRPLKSIERRAEPRHVPIALVEPTKPPVYPVGASVTSTLAIDERGRSLGFAVFIAVTVVTMVATTVFLVGPNTEHATLGVLGLPPPSPNPTADTTPTNRSEPKTSSATKPEPDPQPERKTKPTVVVDSPPKPTPRLPKGRSTRSPRLRRHETDACVRMVSEARGAAQSFIWKHLDTLTRNKQCFADPQEWAEMRVLALSNTGQFVECVALADDTDNPTVQRYARICRTQKGE